jgi:hypothetical protein
MHRAAKASDKSINLADATMGDCCFEAGTSSTDTIRLFVDSDVDSWASSAFGGSCFDLSPTAPSPASREDGRASTASWSPRGETIRDLLASLERRSRIIHRNSSGIRSVGGRRGAAAASVVVGVPVSPTHAEAGVPSLAGALLAPGAPKSAGVSAAFSGHADTRSSPEADAGDRKPTVLSEHRSVHAQDEDRTDEELPRPWLARIAPALPGSPRQAGGRRRGQPDGGRSWLEKTYGFGAAVREEDSAATARGMTLDKLLRRVPPAEASAVPLSPPAPPRRMLDDLPSRAPLESTRTSDPPPLPAARLDRAPRRPQRHFSRDSLEPLSRGPPSPAAEEAGVVNSGRAAQRRPATAARSQAT